MAFSKKYKACDDCGVRNLIDNKFCSNCGKSFEGEEGEGEGEESQEDTEIERPEIEQKVKVSNIDDKFVVGKIPTQFEPVSIEKSSNKPFTSKEEMTYVMNSLNEILKILRG